jgi:hypothetical protein
MAAQEHRHSYNFDQPDSVTLEKLDRDKRLAHGKEALAIPHTDADHVFEVQMFNKHLEKHNLEFENLHPKLKKKVIAILNGPGNMAPVPASVNRGKGQLIKQGMKGNAISPKEPRNAYTLLSYPTAKKVAYSLDRAFKKEGHKFGDDNFRQTLRDTMNNAKILNPGDHSPEGSSKSTSGSSDAGSSDAGSSKGKSRRSSHFQTIVSRKKKAAIIADSRGFKGKVNVAAPRRSKRIAAKGKK